MNHLALIGLTGFLLLLIIGILGVYIALQIKFPAPRRHDTKHESCTTKTSKSQKENENPYTGDSP